MRPLKGVVIRRVEQSLVIKTEAGLMLKIQQTDNLQVGDPVHVNYDYTKNRVRSIRLDTGKSDLDELNVEEPVVVDKRDEDDDSELISNISGSEALFPLFEGFCDPDSGVLELSVPCSDGSVVEPI